LASWRITGRIVPQDGGGFEVDLVAESDRASRPKGVTVGASTDEELQRQVDDLASQLGPRLSSLARSMAELLAEQNKTKKVSLRRVVNEIYQPFTAARNAHGDDALAFGAEAAIAKGIPNVNYAKKAAQSYAEEAPAMVGPNSTNTSTRYDILGRGQ
jgi:hypothetical protein